MSSRLLLSAVVFSAGLHAAEPVSASQPPQPLVLDAVNVLGSRVRRVDAGDITSVSTFDRDFIAATGAGRLADFLNLLPQTYTGAGSGRGSAPNDFNPEFGVRTETRSPAFNIALGAANVPLGQSGVSGANLRGLGSGSTLVLIDGRRAPIAGQGNRSTDARQGFVDLNTIPLGAIERVEVLADGASALYGSDAIGGVINVVLRKNYAGAELATNYRGTFDGGARERRATLSAGVTSKDARLRGSLVFDLYDRARLSAAQRDFSANQDHTGKLVGRDRNGAPVPGRDLRLNWGYPAVVQARAGTLNGVTAPDGSPARVALVPEGARTTPLPAQFVGANGAVAAGQRRTNTAAFLDLVSPQESRSAGGALEYELRPSIRAYARFSATDVRGRFDAQPPVSTASATTGFGGFATIVPATIDGQANALNPFGQDVIVGLLHAEFGAMRQTTHTRNRSAVGGLTGAIAGRWFWDASVSWRRDRFAQRNLTLDPARFTAALAAADPARRFNPFVDAQAAGPVNAALYPGMTATAAYDGSSELTSAQLLADGPLAAIPGGDLQLAVGADYDYARHRALAQPAPGAPTDARAQRHGRALFAELSVPLFGRPNARPLLRRFELQLAARHQDEGAAGRSTDPRFAALWSPVDALRLRASYTTGFRAPSLTEYETPATVSSATLTDPRRTPASTPGVVVRRGSNASATPETSTNESLGATFAPRFARGLALTIDYRRVRQRDTLQLIEPQPLVNNEGVFFDRITRGAPTALDIARGQPGPIAAVDATLVNFGQVRSESLDLRLDYDVPWRALGHFRVNLAATRTLGATTELRPGVRVDLEGDTGAPPRWRGLGMLTWRHESWNAAVFAHHIGSFASNNAGNPLAPAGTPAMTTVNVTAGYTFGAGVGRGLARGAKLGLGVGNLFDRAPPFSDTVFGYNGGLHSPLGRSYEISVTVPF